MTLKRQLIWIVMILMDGAARAIVRLQQGKYTDAESDLDQAIHLSAKNAGNYINRALARFHQNNLRGAMSDYDLALDIDP